ncbi:GMP reductase [Planctomyces sp. SH-PL62]|uniref:GMP reductase n=1 Tax=Planctomyces sp. SH-PL62 TaxID=1636152 RepID=UPI00078D6FA2|nr:GMP reductase [Planctomyces sp. SH-PL62]AMV40544.1 GMP reductase [Planctomyces sp. SH-PL62]
MRIDNDPKLDFDDVLIRPKRSEAPSRASVELEREYRFLNGGTWRGVPIVASNMDTVGTFAMARAIGPPMLTCLHKYYPEDALVDFFGDEARARSTFFTVGLKDDEFDKLVAVKRKADVRMACVDAANGYTKYFVERVKRIRDTFPELTIMAGNVATPDMVQELLISGAADIVKIGIGPGSVCTTRRTTGVGYPQLSAIIECADAAHGLRGHVCADGGCRYPGDVVKAFAAGADFVMLGGMLAGHDECEGEWVEEDGRRIALEFYGMSSREALDKYAGGRRDYRACEGRAVSVPYKGPVAETMQEVCGGIRSACAYVGATRLKDLSKCTTFVICQRPHGSMFS